MRVEDTADSVNIVLDCPDLLTTFPVVFCAVTDDVMELELAFALDEMFNRQLFQLSHPLTNA